MNLHVNPRSTGQFPQPGHPPLRVSGDVVGQVDRSGASFGRQIGHSPSPRPAPDHQLTAAFPETGVQVVQRPKHERQPSPVRAVPVKDRLVEHEHGNHLIGASGSRR
ncbi:MAG TPA: hypothetical protein VN767_19370 [Streptosporangiaceae bacterium]|nr:hypothetical protein [Streptosporangiaceae bacterium]